MPIHQREIEFYILMIVHCGRNKTDQEFKPPFRSSILDPCGTFLRKHKVIRNRKDRQYNGQKKMDKQNQICI